MREKEKAMTSRDALERIKDLAQAQQRPVSCYDLGYDAAVNGANEVNCHFGIFSTRERTSEWERGNRAGLKAKAAQEGTPPCR